MSRRADFDRSGIASLNYPLTRKCPGWFQCSLLTAPRWGSLISKLLQPMHMITEWTGSCSFPPLSLFSVSLSLSFSILSVSLSLFLYFLPPLDHPSDGSLMAAYWCDSHSPRTVRRHTDSERKRARWMKRENDAVCVCVCVCVCRGRYHTVE